MRRVLQAFIMVITISAQAFSVSHAFEFKGFADTSLTKSTKDADSDRYRNGSFAFGAVDLYFAESLDEVELLSELIVTTTGSINAERLYLGYVFSDQLKLRVGRFHTPLGFWNTSYHHGKQLQPTILRPEALRFEFEGGIFPAHSVGAWVTGRSRTSAGLLEYGIQVANGPKIVLSGSNKVLNPNNTSDNNIGKAVSFNAAICPVMIEDLKVGVSGHFSRVKDDTATPPLMADVNQEIYVAAFTYSPGNVNLAGEYFNIGNRAESDKNYNSSAYFGLITYNLTEKWVPYILYDKMLINESDPYFQTLNTKDVTKTTLGVRYNISYMSSLKGEVRAVKRDNKDWNEFALQWAIAF
ncbi:MAG: hypothetical protein IT393_03170 [Nitrospirae bacterium]|nr:hypothetical protein [Nitrospirota bacterium]